MVLGISGCTFSVYRMYNFSRGEVLTSNVGDVMIDVTDERKNDTNGNIESKFETTLTYSGKQGKIIKIFYREFSDNLARQAFTQDLTYDITEDKIITFRSTKIKVLSATNSRIKFIVLESPVYAHPSGDTVNPNEEENNSNNHKSASGVPASGVPTPLVAPAENSRPGWDIR